MTTKPVTLTDDPFSELNSLFSPAEVPDTIIKPKKPGKTPNSIEELRASKVETITQWRAKLANGTARGEGRQSKGDLSIPTADPNFITVRLTHGPAGNLKLYLNGVWKEDHIIPAKLEDAFWKATITLIEKGMLDEELNSAKKRMFDIYHNEDGTKKPRKVKSKSDDNEDDKPDLSID